MTSSFVLAVALATCPTVEADRMALTAAPVEAFGRALASAEDHAGGPLLGGNEREAALEARRRLALTRLPEACAFAELPALPVRTDAEALRAILDRPEFRGARQRTGGLEQLWARLFEWLESMLALRGSQTFAETTRTFVLIAAGLAAVAVLLRGWRARRAPLSPNVPPPMPMATKAMEDPAFYLSQARRLLDPDPRGAIRNGLLALLASLEQRHWAHPDRARTNREVASGLEARGAPIDISHAVGTLCTWYDRTFYSLDPVTPALAAPFLRDVSALTQKLRDIP